MKIYCELCEKAQPFTIDPIRKDKDFPKQGLWGDIVCSECSLVIATLSDFKEEGVYEVKKIKEIK